MRRGEVRWYRFAAPDKRRPVLLLTRNSIISSLGEVTVAPITTNVRGIPSEVALSVDDGLPRDCAVNCDHVQTIPKQRLGATVAALPSEKMSDVAAALRFALELG